MGTKGDPTLGASEQFKLLESLLQQVLHKDVLATPAIAHKRDIKQHLEKLEQYFRMCGIVSEETKIAILFNSLLDDMRYELCGALEFKAHEDNYSWIADKLMDMFCPKESEISPLVKLYSCKQGSSQSIREFLSEIRIEGYKLLKELNPEEREKHLLDAFTKGLYNEELRLALSMKEVNTLDEAYRLVKKEKSNSGVEGVRKMEIKTDQQTSELEKLQNQMLMLQKQLTYIVTILENIKPSNRPSYADITRRKPDANEGGGQYQYTRNGPRRSLQQNRDIQCWNCGANGHIARNCRSNRCSACGQAGHAARYCRADRKPRRVRRIWEDKGNEEWEVRGADDKLSDSSSQESEAQSLQEIPEVCALTIHPSKYSQGHVKTANAEKRIKKYPDYIVELEEFVEGKRPMKKTCLVEERKTAKTSARTELDRNKPLVRGKCEGKQTKLFLDTGAEINVVDEEFIQQMRDHPIHRHRQDRVIKCANNSKMDTKGWVRLQIEVGGRSKRCKFWVVKNLFPKVIVGIRAMRDMGMTIDPANECVWVSGRKVNFTGRVQPQSLQSESGNASQPGLRVEGRQ